MTRVLLLVSLGLFSCEPFRAPTPLSREVAAKGDAPVEKAPAMRDAGLVDLPDGGCCPVRFARRALDGEVAVQVFGFTLALAETPLSKDGGIWEGVVCMMPARTLYGYRVFMRADDPDAGLFDFVTYNPNAPQLRTSDYGLLNEFDARDAGSCADFQAAAHGDTTVADAGFLDADGGTDGGADGG